TAATFVACTNSSHSVRAIAGKQVGAGEQRLLAASQIVDGPVDHAMDGFAQSVHGDVEIVDVHGTLLLRTRPAKAGPPKAPRRFGFPALKARPAFALRLITQNASPLAKMPVHAHDQARS